MYYTITTLIQNSNIPVVASKELYLTFILI